MKYYGAVAWAVAIQGRHFDDVHTRLCFFFCMGELREQFNFVQLTVEHRHVLLWNYATYLTASKGITTTATETS